MIFLSKYDKKNDSFNQITFFNKILKKPKIWIILKNDIWENDLKNIVKYF